MRVRDTATYTRYRNWLNRRAWTRGKDPLPDRAGRAAGSRTPLLRNQIHPATGRPRWTDRNPAAMARWREQRSSPAGRAAVNQQHVRDTLASRQPQYARSLERAVRDVSRSSGRSSR